MACWVGPGLRAKLGLAWLGLGLGLDWLALGWAGLGMGRAWLKLAWASALAGLAVGLGRAWLRLAGLGFGSLCWPGLALDALGLAWPGCGTARAWLR